MASCYICSETLNFPVCLPCGHVFCSQCILLMVQKVKSNTPVHRCPTCGSCYSTASLDTETVPSNLRPFVTPSVRPLHMHDARSDSKTESTCSPASPPWTSNQSSIQPSNARSSCPPHPAGLSDVDIPSEMARLRAENHALRNSCFLWRKRAETHGEANLNLLKFAQAIRDQASQISRDRNELEKRCFMLKRQLDGECSYSDETQKYGKLSQPPALEPNLGHSTQIGEDRSYHTTPLPAFHGSKLPSDQSRKRPRTSIDNGH